MTKKITFGSLFAGIGGFDLGLERAGMECKWQVEKDDYATQVLEKHWPKVKRWGEIDTFPPRPSKQWKVDLIAGGFPCQPVSQAGQRKAQADPRWLWPEFYRVICELRPRCVIIENVPCLLTAGFTGVIADLAEIGFDAEWDVLPASAFGVPQLRERLFVVAYPSQERCKAGVRREVFGSTGQEEASNQAHRQIFQPDIARRTCSEGRTWFDSGGSRMVHGISDRVERIKCLGNAVIPQVAEFVGRRAMEFLN